MEIIDLAALRKSAGLTQAQVAEALDLSQSQVSRYEADPSEASMKLVKAWTELCGDVRKTRGLMLGENKRKKIAEALDSIYGWFRFAPPVQNVAELPDLAQMVTSIKKVGRKPRIAVAGKFDTGKSTLLNYLLGGKHLPTAYQPTTSLVCHIRHIDDKPTWQTEPVWIMKQGYNLDDPDDQVNAEKHKIFAGGYETLKLYGQHRERISDDAQPAVAIEDAVVAVVYLNSPILEAADFIDLPGYENNEADKEKAGLATNIFDSLIYTSTTNGFFDGQDMIYLRVLLDKLPPVTIQGTPQPLANLFVLCTQIHAISAHADGKTREQILSDLLDGANQRAAHELEATLEAASQQWEVPITPTVLRQRMFGFSVDDTAAQITDTFVTDLKNYLESIAPQSTLSRLKQILSTSKEKQITALIALGDYLEQSISNRAQAQREFDEVLAKKEASKAHFANESKRLGLMIDEYLDTTQMIVKEIYGRYVNVEFIEKEVRLNYKDKKDAEKYLGSFLLDKVQREINKKVALLSEKLNGELNKVLSDMSCELSPSSITSFDAKSAFLSALTGVGAAGALAGWAAVVAAGSNLGAYILAAKIVGWLSAMGISVGGPAAVMSTIAALGGPVTIAAGIGILLASALYAAFGKDWQSRIAKKTVEQFNKQKVEEQILVTLNQYWRDTKSALNHSMAETLKSYDKYLAERKTVLSLNESDIQERIVMVKNVEGFLRSMPQLPATI